MSKEITWEELLKERYSEKSEKKKENTEIRGFKRDFNFKRMNTTKKDNKYYHTELLELDPKKILKRVTDREKADDLAQRRKEAFRGKENHKIIDISYTFGTPIASNVKSLDDEKIKKENLKRTLNGQNVKMAIETLKNFDADEIDSKMWVIQDLNNSPETLQKYSELYKNKGNFDPHDRDAKEFEKFFSKYKILEEPKYDEESGMSALVIGNKDTKKVEIIFGASQGYSNTRLDGEKGERAKKDWHGNNFKSFYKTTKNKKAAKKFTYDVIERYKNGQKVDQEVYKELTTVNGHSKAGGEAIYSASHIPGLKCFAIDPAPVTNCGSEINHNNLLTIVPNMGHGALSTAENIEGTEFYTLRINPSTNNTNFHKTLALPVECNERGEHFPDNEMAVDRLRELQKYANKVEKKLEEQTRNSNTKNDDIITNVR